MVSFISTKFASKYYLISALYFVGGMGRIPAYLCGELSNILPAANVSEDIP